MPTPTRSACSRSSSRSNRTTPPCSSSARGWPPSAATARCCRTRSAPRRSSSAAWPPEVVERYRALQQATRRRECVRHDTRDRLSSQRPRARARRFARAVSSLPHPAELIAEPFTRFLRLATPVATPSAADTALTFTARSSSASAPTSLSYAGGVFPRRRAASGRARRRCSTGASAGTQRRHRRCRFRRLRPASRACLVALDWNHDFKMDLVAAGPAGVRLFIQSADGAFSDETVRASRDRRASRSRCDWRLGRRHRDGRRPRHRRWRSRGGDDRAEEQWRRDVAIAPAVCRRRPVFAPSCGATSTATAIPMRRRSTTAAPLHVFANLQAGQFKRFEGPPSREKGYQALAIGDVNADGALDLVTLETLGAIRRATLVSRAVEPGAVDGVAGTGRGKVLEPGATLSRRSSTTTAPSTS